MRGSNYKLKLNYSHCIIVAEIKDKRGRALTHGVKLEIKRKKK